MNFIQNLRERRVPQYLSAYCFGGYGLVRFVEFLEGRLQFSPHWVNLTAVGLLLLLPTVIMFAWSQGRPGKDKWGRIEKIFIPLKLVLVVAILFLIFHGKDLGAVTTTVAVEDENGKVTERVVPKTDYRKRIVLYAFENTGPADQQWLCHGLPVLLDNDLSQDPFVDTRLTAEMIAPLRDAGFPEGLDLPRALQRKVARESHYSYFLTGKVWREGEIDFIATELHASDTGRVLARREFQGPDITVLVDELSLQLRKDLDIPAGYINQHPDVAVAEIISDDLVAIEFFVRGAVMITLHNDWEAGKELLKEAAERDPTFALAQYLLSTSYSLTNHPEEAAIAINASMAHLYRLSERTQLQIKAVYYFNEQDVDKSMAVLDMWTQLYPQDSEGFLQKAFFMILRNDRASAISAYEEVLRINPHQYEMLLRIGGLYQDEGDYPQAEKYLTQYAECFPTSIQAWTELADLYLDYGELTQAAETLEKALLVEPGHIATRCVLASIAARDGRFAEAGELLANLRTSANSGQELADVIEEQLKLSADRGRIGNARVFLDDYMTSVHELYDPTQISIIHALKLRFLVDVGKSEEMLVLIDNMVSTAGPMIDLMIAYFKFEPLIELNRLDEAQTIIDKAEELINQMKIEIWRSRIAEARGSMAIARSDFDEAKAFFRRAVETSPTSTRLQRSLGRVLRLTGKFDEAEQVLNKVLKYDPANGQTNFELAKLFAESNQLTRAQEHLRLTLRAWEDADPDFIPAIEARAFSNTLNSLP